MQLHEVETIYCVSAWQAILATHVYVLVALCCVNQLITCYASSYLWHCVLSSFLIHTYLYCYYYDSSSLEIV